jgi:hypothetical protein
MPISEHSKRLQRNIASALHGVEIPIDNRTRIAGAFFDIVHEHSRAILILLESGLCGSAMSLVRSIFEAYVRGVWFMKCASPAHIEKFLEDRLKFASFEAILKQVENVDHAARGALQKFKEDAWPALNSYTHGGFRPIGRRFSGSEIKANYSQENIQDIERWANLFAVISLSQTAELAANANLKKLAGELTLSLRFSAD